MNDLNDFITQYNQYIANPQAFMQANNIGMTQNPSQQSMSQFQNTPAYMLANGTNATSSNPLINYLNSPQYSLLYGQQNAAQQVANVNNGTYNPTTAFQQDPGYQFNLQQGMQQIQQHAAAQGLLNSGPVQQQLLSYANGLQNQSYQNWLSQQNSLYNQQQSTNNSLFSNYQNQLANLANFGSTQTGGAQALTNSQQLANLIASGNLTTGQEIGSANLGTSENIAQLLANQGVLNANAYLNTGGAMSNNILQGALLTAQQQAANQGAANSTANSLLGAQGAMAGFNSGFGGVSNVGAGTQYPYTQSNTGPNNQGSTTYYGNGQSTYTGSGGQVF